MVLSRQVHVNTYAVVSLNQLEPFFIKVTQRRATVVEVIEYAEFHGQVPVFERLAKMGSAVKSTDTTTPAFIVLSKKIQAYALSTRHG
ncbi:MAG: hypothetical protein RL442_2459 [Pseudomonadota bacterium]|jgi:hypothetical protein